MKTLSRSEARAIDKAAMETYGIPGIVLMENAGRGIVDYFLAQKPQGKIVICCGKGNNGGDGYVIARHLDNQNIPVHILSFAKPSEIMGDAKINYDIVLKSNIHLTPIHQQDIASELFDAEWIIDGLLGTGLQGEVQEPFVDVIHAINQARKKVLAIDIPSGLDCDTGEPLGCAIIADCTATMVGMKKGFNNPHAKNYLGHIFIVDIGIPKQLFT